MNYLAAFFAGAFFCNALPHLLSGVQGEPFPSPFSKPPGVGDSPPLVNFLWGSFNLLVAIALLVWHPIDLGFNVECAVFIGGFLLMGIGLAHHFGKVRQG